MFPHYSFLTKIVAEMMVPYVPFALAMSANLAAASSVQHPLFASGAQEQESAHLPLVVWHGLGDKYGVAYLICNSRADSF